MDQCREFFPLHQHYGAALRQETVKLSLKVDAASSKAHGLQDAWLAPAWVMSVPFFFALSLQLSSSSVGF